MSQQALDLRRSLQIVRRHKILVGVVWRWVSSRAPLTPAPAADADQHRAGRAPAVSRQRAARPQTAGGPDTLIRRPKVVIAGSDPVLFAAMPDVRPAMSLAELRSEFRSEACTGLYISISAKGKTAADAEATANAVANSYISYVSSAKARSGSVRRSCLSRQPAPRGPVR